MRHRARVVVNERTGTVVLGKEVRLGAVSILHGISDRGDYGVYSVEPNPVSTGKTVTVPETTVKAEEAPARRIELMKARAWNSWFQGCRKLERRRGM